MTVYALENSYGIAAGIARSIGDKLVQVEYKLFPDGESYIRVQQRPEGPAVLVASLYPNTDKRIFELFMAVEALRAITQDVVIGVVPYMAYARQDRRFLDGEPISVKVVLKTLETLGLDALIVVDIHKPAVLDEYWGKPYRNVLVDKQVADYFKGKLSNPLILAPDAGALERAKRVAEQLNADYDHLVKERDRVTGEVRVSTKEISVTGRDILIVDDIISTGGTMALAAKTVLAQGARSVYASCTHAVMVKGALDLLLSSGIQEVVATDTVPSPVSKISVTPATVEALKDLLEEVL
ncbi:ribose-phosphate diphosphokinase [Infirmifilum sp. NZ]|uniref:ribose-phosphate diphosphokinase n=1 Tax=Infirmifilum sp. NZ TaxID=2926850 RepID=UPI0027A61F17|nr:ribose-phosphate diphosphokinase [Infirmifilum sp. NZ]UNQ74269.1 ribose-phosphate diphosphokinase [Infirmifilum sp. NZ]